MEKETWKDIPSYEGLYQVSNLGRVKGLDRIVKTKNGRTQYKKGTVLKNKMGTNGYHYVCLYKNNKQKTFMIHSLVALNFIGDRPYKNDICHINGNRLDNRVSNLKYDTRAENFNDMYRQGKKNPKGKLSVEDVLEIRKMRKEENVPYKELAIIFGVSESTIGYVVTKRSYWYINDDGTINESKTQMK